MRGSLFGTWLFCSCAGFLMISTNSSWTRSWVLWIFSFNVSKLSSPVARASAVLRPSGAKSSTSPVFSVCRRKPWIFRNNFRALESSNAKVPLMAPVSRNSKIESIVPPFTVSWRSLACRRSRYWQRNSSSNSPPRAYLTCHISSVPCSRSILFCMSATSVRRLTGSRGNLMIDLISTSNWCLNLDGATITLALVSAMCSQVQARDLW